jgi:hypothetical protein
MAFIQRVIEVADERKISLDLIIPDDIPNGETVVKISFVPVKLDGPWVPLEDIYKELGIFQDSKAFSEDAEESRCDMRDE